MKAGPQRRRVHPARESAAAETDDSIAKRRTLRPRPSVVVRPSYISNETCFAIGSIVARKFVELIVPKCHEVTRLGRTVMVPIDEFERVVRELGQVDVDAGEGESAEGPADDEPRSVDDVLRRIGKERVAS
jgi:hypothetical protein